MIKKIIVIFIFILFIKPTQAKEDTMILKLKYGNVIIELFDDIAPNHVKRFKQLASEKKYDGVIFHLIHLNRPCTYIKPRLTIDLWRESINSLYMKPSFCMLYTHLPLAHHR